jgi:hypothetical protein
MKYFTTEWRNGSMPDLEVERVTSSYWHNLARIAPRLPFNVHKLATEMNLHDGLFVQFRLNRNVSEVSIRLISGDLRSGYRDITLRYVEVSIEALDPLAISTIAANPASELLYDEIDIDAKGLIHHAMAFYPFGEVEVIFKDVKITENQQLDRSTPIVIATYVEETAE